MKKALFMLSSITYAMKGRELLSLNGIKCEIKRVPKNKVLSGCGYGLLIYEKVDEAAEILSKAHLKILDKKSLGEKL